MSLISLEGVKKTYRSGRMEYTALKRIDLEIERGELTAIVGPSGCGKSTMLNMITGIDKPTKGKVTMNGVRLDGLGEDKMARWRGAHMGIIFQFFQLFPTLNALENAMLPMDLAGKWTRKERKKRAARNLEAVGLGDKLTNLPTELSGGEQQRVAIARSLANDPDLIIGDEPTGNLDSVTEKKMFQILKRLNEEGKTVIYVTHSKELASRANRRITMLDGRILT